MFACTCAGIMAAATLRDLYRSGMVNHASVAFFFVLFSLEKSFVEDGTGREKLTDFSTF
jgi:hypothetical protein